MGCTKGFAVGAPIGRPFLSAAWAVQTKRSVPEEGGRPMAAPTRQAKTPRLRFCSRGEHLPLFFPIL